MKKRCNNCFYRVSVKYSVTPAQYGKSTGKITFQAQINTDYSGKAAKTAECHRYPPAFIQATIDGHKVVYFGWPPIMVYVNMKNDFEPWCGEFKPQKDPPPPIEG